MLSRRRFPTHDPHWCDAVMKFLPRMYRLGQVSGRDDYLFVYATTFYSVGEELRRGATDDEIRRQRSQILQDIDRVHRPEYDKELFAAPFARAVDDALEGRSPCALQSPCWADEGPPGQDGLSLDILDLIQHAE
jgi:hypothetical protein